MKRVESLKSRVIWAAMSYLAVAGIALLVTVIWDRSNLLGIVKMFLVAPVLVIAVSAPFIAVMMACLYLAALFRIRSGNRNRMQVYRIPKNDWRKAARQYRSRPLQVCLGSPPIELDGCQYMEILYLNFFDVIHPAVKLHGMVVLRETQSAENNPLVARRISRLGYFLLNSTLVPSIQALEGFADLADLVLVKMEGREFSKHIAWCEAQERVLCEYATEDTFESFLRVAEQVSVALQCRATEASRMLKVLYAILRRDSVPNELLEALGELRKRVVGWNHKVVKAFVECSALARELHGELSGQRDMWRRKGDASRACKTTLRAWQAVDEAGRELKDELDAEGGLDFPAANVYESSLRERIDNKMALYAIPLLQEQGQRSEVDVCSLTDAEIDGFVDDLPSVPENVPWRRSRVKQVASRALGV